MIPKPDPEICQLAPHHLDMPASEILNLEDFPAGMKSALDAGVSVIAVITPFAIDCFHRGNPPPPDRIVDDHAAVILLFDRLLNSGV